MSSVLSQLEKSLKKIFWIIADPGMRSENAVRHLGRSPDVLILRPDRLGDLILSVPALRVLRGKLGDRSRWTIVAGEGNQDAVRFFFPEAKIWVFRKSLFRRAALWVRLRLGRFDVTIDLHSYPFSTTSALMTLLSGSPCRVGFWDSGEFRDLSRKVFNFGVPSPSAALHEAEKSFLLVKKLVPGANRGIQGLFPLPPVPASVAARVRSFFRGIGIESGDKVIGIHPTLRKKDNRWLPRNYLDLIEGVGEGRKIKFIVVHGRDEQEESRDFQRALGARPNVFLLPASDLLFILEAAKRFDLFVGGDSGLTHLAALVTKVLSIFGPSDPGRWGPLSGKRGRPMIFRKRDSLCDSTRPAEVAQKIRRSLKIR